MRETARLGGGVASFGSDESMISNVFIRWVAWALTTLGKKPPQLTVRTPSTTTTLQVSAMRWGTPYQYLLLPPEASITHKMDCDSTESNSGTPPSRDTLQAQARLTFCETLERCILRRDITPLLQLHLDHLDPTLKNECLPNGQIGMAFQPRYFKTWGQAYLYATLRGHEIGHQWNFKDPSLQKFTSPAFEREVEQLDRIFQMMPSPTPSREAHESIQSHGGMSQVFNNSSSTCWLPDSPITLANGEVCKIQNLRPGMEVVSFDPLTRRMGAARIKWMVRQPCPHRTSNAISLGESKDGDHSTLLTPNHPILDFSATPTPRYRHAKDIGDTSEYTCDYLYNMVLDRHHHVVSDGVVCLTMGHGLTKQRLGQLGLMGHDVAVHDYFGNWQQVVADLEHIGVGNFPRNGPGLPPTGGPYVTIDPARIQRDPNTGWVVRLC